MRLVMMVAALIWLLPAPSGPEPQPQPLPAPVVAASAIASPAAAPSAAPVPAATNVAAPLAAPSVTYGYVFRTDPTATDAADGAPRIREIDMTDKVIVAPMLLQVRVLTSPDVVSVTASTMGRSLPLPKEDVGVFGGASTIPSMPDFLRGQDLSIDVSALAQNGRSTHVTLSVQLR